MMAAAMAFAAAVTFLLSVAARVLEKTASLCGLPRRGIWILALVASWLLPLGMIEHANPGLQRSAVSVSAVSSPISGVPIDTRTISNHPAIALIPDWPRQAQFDEVLLIGWGLASGVLIIIWAMAAFRLRRRAKKWPVIRINEVDVLVTDDFGPAVFGYIRPRIVMPMRILGKSNAVRAIALQHEQTHVDARDPLLLLMGLVLVFLAPWNIALWWQLRRLRFAIEVDCDARVLRHGVKPVEYGETLLSISQAATPAALLTMAVTGSASQLERRIRIMMLSTVRHRRALAALTLAIATSLVLSAAALSAPAPSFATSLVKPPPAIAAPGSVEAIVALIKDRYPALLTDTASGTPVVFALFNSDGTAERTDLEVFPGSPKDFKASKEQFERFGVPPAEINSLGRQGIETRTNRTILVIYAQRTYPPSDGLRLFADSRAIDRTLTERYFPRAFEHGVSAGEVIWIMFSHDGSVLHTGDESMETRRGISDNELLRMLTRTLESRYPGIKVSTMTVTPVINANGHAIKNASGSDLELDSVWLAPKSGYPGASGGQSAAIANRSVNNAKSEEKKFAIDAKDTDTREVLAMIARKGNQNVLVSDQIRGRITIHLKDVTWRDALNIVALSQGLVTRQSGNITLVGVAH